MCLLCKGSYDRELAKLAAEQKGKPASRPEVAKPGLPHWMQPSSDQPEVCVFSLFEHLCSNEIVNYSPLFSYRPRSKS